MPAGPMNGEHLAIRLILVIILPDLSSFSSLKMSHPGTGKRASVQQYPFHTGL